jgi:hypothetical protein
MKSTMPTAKLSQKLAWVNSTPVVLVRFIGRSELASAIGLILPAATRFIPRLTPIAVYVAWSRFQGVPIEARR